MYLQGERRESRYQTKQKDQVQKLNVPEPFLPQHPLFGGTSYTLDS